ncbi:hypothetical protein [Olsenella profusa]|nr:hypothetical protein [Olsenella profusa]
MAMMTGRTEGFGRALEDEFLELARSLGGDVASRARGDAYLARTNALYHGAPCDWAFTPKIFDRDQIATLADAAETMGRIMEKVTCTFCADERVRRLFNLPPALERLALVPGGYERQIPLARVDVFFDEETGDYQFCELNTDGSAGMTNTVEVTRAIQQSETYRRFAARHPDIRTFDILNGAVDALLDTYASWREGHPTASERPAVAIVDYTESASLDELEDILMLLSERGLYAQYVDIRTLRVGETTGVPRLMMDDGPIDLVYRRAVTSEVAERPCPGVDALTRAAAEGLACVAGGYRTWPCAAKTVFVALYDPLMEEVLSPEELDFVRRHVPYTQQLAPESDLAPFAERDRWIVKPAGGYNAVGVTAGRDCTQAEWESALARTARANGVAQAYAPQYRTPVMRGGVLGPGEDPLAAEPMSNMEGLYLFNGRFGGVFTRCGTQSVIGEHTHRLNMGCLVVG